MGKKSKRRSVKPTVDEIPHGQISAFVAVAEQLPEVFKAHVVPKLSFKDTLSLAQVSKYFNDAVWSEEAVISMDEKIERFGPSVYRLDPTGQIQIPFPTLHAMTVCNNCRALKALLRTDVDLEKKTVRGQTALVLAAGTGNLDPLKLLLEAGADKDGMCQPVFPHDCDLVTPLIMAVRYENIPTMSALVEAGANLELKSDMGGFKFTALAMCMMKCDSSGETMRLLLDAGANPNCDGPTKSEYSLLNVMVKNYCRALDCTTPHERSSWVVDDPSYLKKVEMLVDAGADPFKRDESGMSPFEVAIGHQCTEMFAILAKHCAIARPF